MNILKTLPLIVAMLVAVATTTTLADDVVPAPWRGTGLYTFQEWEFHTPGTSIPPDGELGTINPNGTPFADVGAGLIYDPSFDTTGLDGWVGGPSGGTIVFEIPNFIDFEPVKLVRVQINGVWDTTPAPTVSGIAAIDNVVGPATTSAFIDSDETFPGFHRWEDWRILPNPDSESIGIFIPAGTFVNQVVIETTSIPEPTSLALLGLGGLLLSCRSKPVRRQ